MMELYSWLRMSYRSLLASVLICGDLSLFIITCRYLINFQFVCLAFYKITYQRGNPFPISISRKFSLCFIPSAPSS
jgi:hypothetical protein